MESHCGQPRSQGFSLERKMADGPFFFLGKSPGNEVATVGSYYGAPFVNLLFDLFWEDFLMIYFIIYDNLAQWLNNHK